LQLTLSNAVPRARYIAAKFVGSWLGLTIPATLAVILGLLLLFVYNIPMAADHWVRFIVLLGISLLLLTFFVAFGIFVSSVTRRSSVSFLICLVSWVAFVLIIPRAGVMISGQIVQVPSAAEVQNQYDMYSKDRWNQEMKRMTDTWQERMKGMAGLTDAQRQAKQNELRPQWQDEDNAYRVATLKDIDANGRKLNEEVRNKKLAQERVAFSISRLSPVSAYQLAVMNLAGTDTDLKNRYEDVLNAYRATFNDFRDRKQKESGSDGGLRISVDSKTGIKIDTGREIALDLSTVPQFVVAALPLMNVVGQAVVDYGLLAVYSLLALAGAFLAFRRYDVR
ncbi:MAG TPA: ABC transporter permease subunit, partial [Bacteroidota bacterium]|nr:ABC transporter permease subunit [Bacteroidota bacterium]